MTLISDARGNPVRLDEFTGVTGALVGPWVWLGNSGHTNVEIRGDVIPGTTIVDIRFEASFDGIANDGLIRKLYVNTPTANRDTVPAYAAWPFARVNIIDLGGYELTDVLVYGVPSRRYR